MARVTPASYSVYAPLRYEITRPFAKKFCDKAKKEVFLRGRESADRIFMNELWSLMNKKISISPHTHAIAMNESAALESYYDFFSGGRIIYDFRKNLTIALLATDAGKVSFSSVKFPSESFYLHFGDIKWPEDFPLHIEGVYAAKYKDGFGKFGVRLLPISKWKFSSPFNIELDKSHDCRSIFVNLQGDYADIDGFLSSETSDVVDIVDDLSHLPNGREFANFLGFSSSAPTRDAMIVRVFINCLLYLSAVPSDIHEDWDDRAPREIVMRARDSEKEGTRQSAERSLANQDYLKIKLIGRKFSEGANGHGGQSAKKATHLRRGHFKNQAYGPEWSEHRVIFVPPVLVNSDSGEIPGRIYET